MPEKPSYIPQLDLGDFCYSLPEERIAKFPVTDRSSSKLLVADCTGRQLSDCRFSFLATLLPNDAMLVVNDTKVVRARLHMTKQTGGSVEILLLDPVSPSNDPVQTLSAHTKSVWKCMVGGLKKVRGGKEVHARFHGPEGEGVLFAQVIEEDSGQPLVEFHWEPSELCFADVLEGVGSMPLPPYIQREVRSSDVRDYQTVYAREEGAVAAPTAGLHFTPQLLSTLEEKGVERLSTTLHVGAGTFAPLKAEDIAGHDMHGERVSITMGELARLYKHSIRREESQYAPFVIVGTTSLRVVESIYWFGVRLLRGDCSLDTEELFVDQWDPYRLMMEDQNLPSPVEALKAVMDWGETKRKDLIVGLTRIMIVPGYRFAMCDGLITNFHQPESTLILLVAAFAGEEFWGAIYQHATDNEYRFLSFGDSSILIRQRFQSTPS